MAKPEILFNGHCSRLCEGSPLQPGFVHNQFSSSGSATKDRGNVDGSWQSISWVCWHLCRRVLIVDLLRGLLSVDSDLNQNPECWQSVLLGAVEGSEI